MFQKLNADLEASLFLLPENPDVELTIPMSVSIPCSPADDNVLNP